MMFHATARRSMCAIVLCLGAAAFVGDALAEEPGEMFVRVGRDDPRYFELTDGSPYIPIGINLATVWGEDGLGLMERWITQLAENGGNFARVWLSSDYWDIEHAAAGVYDEEKGKRIDALIDLAARNGIRLKLTLEHFREIDPNSGYTKTWAIKTLHHASRGGTADSMDDWFDGEASRNQFRKKIAWYRARYGDCPTIFGWELWNEVNAARSNRYLPWTAEMLEELQRSFPRNLAMQSLGSYDRTSCEAQYDDLCALFGNDVAQVHRYLDLGASLEVCHGPVDVLAADAVSAIRRRTSDRPILLAESGAVEPGHSGPSLLYAKDRDGVILHDVLFAPFFAGAAGAGHCWHWGEYVDKNGLWSRFARFAEAVRDIDPGRERFTPKRADGSGLRVYALQGKNTTVAWCRDSRTSWRTELQEGAHPETVEGATLSFHDVLPSEGETALRVRIYDPWTDAWTDGRLDSDGRAALPTFRRSLVVRLEADR